MISIKCNCGETYTADEEHVGRKIRCRCGNVIEITASRRRGLSGVRRVPDADHTAHPGLRRGADTLVGGAELPGLTFSPHQSDLRCGPLGWQVFPLRDRRRGVLIPIPPIKSFHRFVNGVRLTVNWHNPALWLSPPPASLILLFSNQLAIVLMNCSPREHFFCIALINCSFRCRSAFVAIVLDLPLPPESQSRPYEK